MSECVKFGVSVTDGDKAGGYTDVDVMALSPRNIGNRYAPCLCGRQPFVPPETCADPRVDHRRGQPMTKPKPRETAHDAADAAAYAGAAVYPATWNDAPSRTVDEVIAALRSGL